MTRMLVTRMVTALLVSLAFGSAAPATGPSNKNDQTPIGSINLADSKVLYDAVAAEYAQQLAVVQALYKTDQEKPPSLRQMRALGKANADLARLFRVSGQLILAGEPAGVDFQMRTRQLQKTNSTMIRNYRAALRTNTIVPANLPQVSREITNIRARIAKTAAARARVLKEVQTKINQKLWEPAETQLFAASEELRKSICFLTGMEANEILAPFQTLASRIAPPLTDIRRRKTDKRLSANRKAMLPKFAAFAKEVDSALAGVRQKGTFGVEGKEKNGPELIEYFGNAWKGVHWKAQQCRALEWSRCAILLKPNTPELLDLEVKLGALPLALGQAFAEIIKADAARLSSADIPARHAAYLRALAGLNARCSDQRFAAAVEPALRELAAKAKPFAAEVADYEHFTKDLLRWRKRLAASKASEQRAAFPDARTVFVEACRSRPNFPGLFPETLVGKKKESQPELRGPTPTLANVAGPALLDKAISVGGSVGLDDAALVMSQYHQRVWASFSKPSTAVAAAIAGLKSDLQVSEKYPPLSLAAASAIHSAEQNDLRAAGGTIKGFHFESLISRFASLPQTTWAIHSLGTLPLENIGQPPFDALHPQPMRQMMVRFELQPKWIRHEFFFIRLAAGR